MNLRFFAAFAAMMVILATGWFVLQGPTAPGTSPTPLRVILSIILLLGIAFLGAAMALLIHHKETHR